MRTFDYSKFEDSLWDNRIVHALSQIHEAKGRQFHAERQKPKALHRLVEIAKLQSTEASNEIEGIRTTETRLKQLLAQKTTPRNRDEREILGYRDALNIVHESFSYIPITPGYILQLHKILFSHTDSAFGGQLKNVQNYISATDSEGQAFILFTPVPPLETAEAMENLCTAYNIAVGKGKTEPLLLISAFIHDFLCIHPFIDGNGRMSRLLTTLLLYRSGYTVGKYISLEAMIEKRKDEYYDALLASQHGWHEGKADATPFIGFLLSIVLAAYREFDERMQLREANASSTEIVRAAVHRQMGRFTKAELLKLCPLISPSGVERGLRALCADGEIVKCGSGKSTYYLRTDT